MTRSVAPLHRLPLSGVLTLFAWVAAVGCDSRSKAPEPVVVVAAPEPLREPRALPDPEEALRDSSFDELWWRLGQTHEIRGGIDARAATEWAQERERVVAALRTMHLREFESLREHALGGATRERVDALAVLARARNAGIPGLVGRLDLAELTLSELSSVVEMCWGNPDPETRRAAEWIASSAKDPVREAARVVLDHWGNAPRGDEATRTW